MDMAMKNLLIAGLTALLAVAPSNGQAKPKHPDRVVSVRVSFTSDEYDPTTPAKATIKCVVRNGTALPIHVPVGFDGGYVQLAAQGLTLSKAIREKDDVKLAWVEPGKEQVVFELPLADLLTGSPKTDSLWRWDWMKRSAPPPSPIYKGRKGGYVAEASFVVSLDLGTRTLKSEPAVLKVKGGGDK
jgi:hypothetical protein